MNCFVVIMPCLVARILKVSVVLKTENLVLTLPLLKPVLFCIDKFWFLEDHNGSMMFPKVLLEFINHFKQKGL